ncbi:MAG: hypothetical protein WKG07_46020 [Hymenobacter sp.]
MTTLAVLDEGESISLLSFEDLLREYHGRSSIAGVAQAFKAMGARASAFPLVDRRSALTSPSRAGSPEEAHRDAFEMVARAVTGERFRLGVRSGRGRGA